jgi:hypothetical protein
VPTAVATALAILLIFARPASLHMDIVGAGLGGAAAMRSAA